MVSEQVKRWSISLAISTIQTKTTRRNYYVSIRMACLTDTDHIYRPMLLYILCMSVSR